MASASRSVSPSRSQATAWHTLDVRDVLELLQSDRTQGLERSEVTHRQELYGPNELQETAGRSAWGILIDQFKNIMLLMLIAVAVVSAALDLTDGGFPKDAIAIFSIVILNGVLGYLQESRAEKALAALKQLASPSVRVIRDGVTTEVASAELVPGDLMVLEAGVHVAADGRVVEAASLQVRESALTGEAQSVTKQATLTLAPETSLGDRINLVFQGTEVVHGRGIVLVTETGMRTELGRIAEMLQSVETEETPLQKRMGQLGNALVGGSLALVAVVVVLGVWLEGWSQFNALLEVSLSMAVAVVPEGLPAVITVTLALGTQRMVRRHALIRKLPAVETLGSVTTICSDKTGTLTQNKMVAQVISIEPSFLSTGLLYVTGEGYSPSGAFQQGDRLIDPKQERGLWLLLLTGLFCNDAVLQKEQGDWIILGDPTEGALITLAGKAGIRQPEWLSQFPRVMEFPFSSERKRMSVVCRATFAELCACSATVDEEASSSLGQSAGEASPYILFMKGSPELVLEHCTQIQSGDRPVVLTLEQRDRIQNENNTLASKGLRVLGFAYRFLQAIPENTAEQETEQDLIWLGLVGILDAPRPEVKEAVNRCLDAGIRPIMITGDHQLTAQAIAEHLGMIHPGEPVLNGLMLQKLSDAELVDQVGQVSVYARVSPEHKLRIVQALQSQGKIVAMTGDGVNDAPALKQANIGIAMGITGTDVSKEASDMVLLDDNFASIVAATEEGRVVYTNIRRFVKYILGSNIGEVLTIASSPLLIPLGGVPLTPLQILWMNLVTDGVPALALAVEPAEPNVMQRPPHDPQESIFARGLGGYMVRIGLVFTILSVSLMVWAYHYTQVTSPWVDASPERWKTMVFTTLCLAQMGHAIAIRSNTRLTIELNPLTNPYVWGAVILTTLLQLMLIYVAPLRDFFGTHVLSLSELGICFGFSTLLFVWVEMEKFVARRWFQSRR